MTRRRFILTAVGALILAFGILCCPVLIERCGPAEAPDVSAYGIRGIDISRHNGEDIDFEKVAAAGYDFVYIKASEGTDFKDPRFVDNIRCARQAGLRVGVYHFFRFDTDGRMQAINLLHSLRRRVTDLPVAIDIEEWGNPDGEATSGIIGRLREMLQMLEDEGLEVIIYTNGDGYERFIRGNFDGYPLWISTFSTPDKDINWTIWQYSHRGSVEGIKGHVDLNVARGGL